VGASGDCTTSPGLVAGLQRAGVDPVVIWFDAHGDVQTPETSASGRLGGMPVRQLDGGADRTGPEALSLRPVCEEDVVPRDARDLDPPEAEYLATAAIRRCTVPASAGSSNWPAHEHPAAPPTRWPSTWSGRRVSRPSADRRRRGPRPPRSADHRP